MEKELKAYKDLDVRRTPTTPDSIYFVLNSTTQKITELWVTSGQNIPKQVELKSILAGDLISSQAGNTLILGVDGKIYNPPSSAILGEIIKVAGENISSGMAIIIDVDNKAYKYDITNYNHAGLSCGIAKTSASNFQTLTIKTSGNVLTEVGSGWQPGKSYFIGSNSILTENPPTVGIIKKIATGVDLDKIIVENYSEYILI